MHFYTGQKIIVDGTKATVTAVNLPGPYGDDSIEYQTEDGTKIKDCPSLSSYYGGKEYKVDPDVVVCCECDKRLTRKENCVCANME
jgi:hypothetical protein